MSEPMNKVSASIMLGLVTLAVSRCAVSESETFKYVRNGNFVVIIRDREIANSGTHIIDLCVSKSDKKTFPNRKSGYQCFFQGTDIYGLNIKWSSPYRIDVFIKDGYVSCFSNYAIITYGQTVPTKFHISLHDGS